jgi:ATP-dependent exoDNAse (exonuclease V) beta subunit
LHFPEALQPSAVYGSAVHQALHFMHTQLTQTGELPPPASVQGVFEKQLRHSPLQANDLERLLTRGGEALALFQTARGHHLHPSDKSEYNFAGEGVRVGEARLSGKTDVLRTRANGSLSIIDYKTGSPLHDWHAKPGYGQIRAHLYKHQLAFYYLLVTGSAHFKNKAVEHLALQFVEPDEDGHLPMLDYLPSHHELERVQALIGAVWQHVQDLNFPDTSHYSLDLKGIKQFEQDLLDGKL